MLDAKQINELFFIKNDLNETKIRSLILDSLKNADDGELFLEYRQSESFSFDDGKLKNASYLVNSGFGLRSIIDDSVAYAYSSEINAKKIAEAASTVQSLSNMGQGDKIVPLPLTVTGEKHHLYDSVNPLNEVDFSNKVKLLQDIDSYIRNKNSLVKQVSVSINAEWQAIEIISKSGVISYDIRPLVRLNISINVEKNGKMESGYSGVGGRQSCHNFIATNNWQKQADEALRQAMVNLDSIPAPAGEMQVVLGAGWPGILLHEAIGHGLEGDFNRKKTSVFSNMMGKRIAAKGVTIVDDGTLPGRRGSINIDDEGTPTKNTVLIEDGILKSYIQDRMNARLMNVPLTGNGRRESFAHKPMPRMTNTYMLAGKDNPEEIISSVKKGIYAINFGGGQVDITSGKFVFSSSEAYLIENGKITHPVKGATLIGSGSDVLTKITAIGNDMKLDEGVGTCGKNGQSVPVGVGQPSLLINGLTVGGTEI